MKTKTNLRSVRRTAQKSNTYIYSINKIIIKVLNEFKFIKSSLRSKKYFLLQRNTYFSQLLSFFTVVMLFSTSLSVSFDVQAATPPLPTERCIANWYRWEKLDIPPNNDPLALNPTTFGLNKITTNLGTDMWYEVLLPFTDQQLGLSEAELAYESDSANSNSAFPVEGICSDDYSDASTTGYGEVTHSYAVDLKLRALNDVETSSLSNADASGDGIASFPALTEGAISYSVDATVTNYCCFRW